MTPQTMIRYLKEIKEEIKKPREYYYSNYELDAKQAIKDIERTIRTIDRIFK